MRKNFIKIAVVLSLIIAILLVGLLLSSGKEEQLIDDSDIVYSSENAKRSFQELVNQASDTSTSSDKGELLAKAFLVVSADYDKMPSPEKRKLLKQLYEQINTEYPNVISEQRLAVPCREEECGVSFQYIPSLLEMKNNIVNLQVESNVKEALLHNLENAALGVGSGNNTDAYNALNLNLSILKDVWKNTNNMDIESHINLIKEELKVLDPERYDKSNKRNFFKLY